MTNIIKEIRKILNNHWSSQIHIHITDNEIWIDIYESEIPLVIDLKKREAYIDCETISHHLNADMLDELNKICRLLEDNMDVIEDLMKWE